MKSFYVTPRCSKTCLEDSSCSLMKLKKYDLSRVKITQVQSSEHDVLQQFRTHIISTEILNKKKISPHQSNCLLSKIQVTMCLQYIVMMCAAKNMLKPHCIISQNAKSVSQLVRLTFGMQKHSIVIYFLRARISSGGPV